MKLFDYIPIPGYEDSYAINKNGTVLSIERFVPDSGRGGRIYKERILRQRKDKDGYMKVTLSKNGKLKEWMVHRLVALTFISNPKNYPCINHKGENKENNYVDNLEWCTVQYNNIYSDRVSRVANKRKKKIAKYDLNGNLICIYNSIKDAILDISGYKSNLIRCCKGKANSYKNYIWKYYEIV